MAQALNCFLNSIYLIVFQDLHQIQEITAYELRQKAPKGSLMNTPTKPQKKHNGDFQMALETIYVNPQ